MKIYSITQSNRPNTIQYVEGNSIIEALNNIDGDVVVITLIAEMTMKQFNELKKEV